MNQANSTDTNLQVSPVYFPGRLAIQQRVLPVYRAEFFDALADNCLEGLSVFAGLPLADESIAVASQLRIAQYVPAHNLHLGRIEKGYYACWQRGILDWLLSWQPHLLITEANPRYLSTRQAVRWMHARKRPVIGWGLGSPKAYAGRGERLASAVGLNRKSFYRMFDGMIAYSQRGAEEYAGLGIPSERIFVAPNAVIHQPTGEFPARPPIFSGPAVLLFIGRLQARKRVDNLLRACASLPAELRPRLLVVGDGPARQELIHLAESIYPLAEFPGAVRGPDLESYFALADLFVLPGTGGLAVQQAMGHGLPVIAAEGDGTQDDLVRPENGWRIPANDVPALRSALVEALSDPVRLRRMGEVSYRIARDEANIEAMVAGFLVAISSISGIG
jgi:glycosyltransferase involved in cell wall biosynthesis